MPRRIHTPSPLRTGDIELTEAEAHHVRDVLRLTEGTRVELFDDAGATAEATIVAASLRTVVVRVEALRGQPSDAGTPAPLVVASAVPKGDRAEWMVEKLSEIGVDRFVPLATARSVVHPEGKNKRDRWTRIATEAAKQSRRRGVMRIDDLAPLAKAIATVRESDAAAWHLSPAGDAIAVAEAVRRLDGGATPGRPLHLFIGPEGGWTDEELASFTSAGFAGVRLTPTVLRIETAALAAAAVVASLRDASRSAT